MTPGPVEEVGKVAVSFTEALKSSPIVLALTTFNILFMGFVWWSTIEERRWRENVVTMMVEQQGKSAEMLSSCVPFKELPNILNRGDK